MRKRDELSDPTSCMSRARDDEWTFVLLGRDVAAPVAVRAWVDERIRLGKNKPNDPQILEAEAWIEEVTGPNHHRLPRRTLAGAVNEAERLLAETFDQLDADDDRDAWFITRLTKIREALADRPNG